MAKQLKRDKTRASRGKTASRQKRSKKLATHYQELQTLQEISQAVLTSLDIQTILERILDKALLVGPFDVGVIRLLDAGGNVLQPAAHRGYRDLANLHSKTTDPKDEATGMVLVQVMAAKGSYQIEDVPNSAGMRSFKKEGVRSAVVVPVRAGEEILGVIQLGSRSPRRFRPKDIHLLESIGSQMGLAVQKTRLFEETERRAQEQAVLNAIAIATSQSLNLDELLQVSLDNVLEVTGREQGYIRLKDPVTGNVTLAAHRGISERYVETLLHERTPGGKSDQVFKSGEPLVINDPEGSLLKDQTRREGSRSMSWFPLKARGRVVGIMNVSTTRPISFQPREVDLLQAIGNVIGVALENARLYQESQQQQEVQRLLKELSQDITSLDIDSLLKKLTQKVREFFKVDVSDVRILEDGRWQVMGVSGTDPEHVQSDSTGTARGRSKWILQNRKPLLIPDITEGEGFSGGESIRKAGIRGYLAVPLFLRNGEVIGILRALTYEPREFSQSEVDLLQQLANGAAIALENARLYEETERRRREAEELARVAKSLTETLDVTAVAERVVTSVREILDVKTSTLRLLQSDGSLRALASRGEGSPRSPGGGQTVPSGMGLTSRAIAEGKPVWSADMLNDPKVRLTDQMRDSQLRSGNSSMLAVPLRAREKIIGALALSDQKGRIYSDSEVMLVQTFVDQAALALENARLFEQTQRNLERIQALRDIDQAVTSTLDLHAVLKVLMEKIDLLLPYSVVQVWLMNKETGVLERTACWNLDEAEWKGRSIRGTPPLVKAAVEGKAPVAVGNLQTDPRTLNRDFYIRHGLVSYLGVPLIVKGQALGVIVFLTREERQFTKEEIEFLSTLAGQAAMAIHNSQLHEQTIRQAGELEKASKVKDEFLGFVSHELRAPLNAVIAYTVMMQDRLLGEVKPEQEETLEKILRYSKELLDMINSLLEVTRIQAGRVEVESHRVDLGRFLEELKSAYDAPVGKPITLNWDIAPDLQSVITDSGKLRHILQNLITNAIKYTERGSVSISARRCAEDRSVRFTVADTGLGIPRESLPVIFEMFRQVSRPDGLSSTGVGLGLHIVKKFTEILGGKIEVESEVGKGSTFTVTLPFTLE